MSRASTSPGAVLSHGVSAAVPGIDGRPNGNPRPASALAGAGALESTGPSSFSSGPPPATPVAPSGPSLHQIRAAPDAGQPVRGGDLEALLLERAATTDPGRPLAHLKLLVVVPARPATRARRPLARLEQEPGTHDPLEVRDHRLAPAHVRRHGAQSKRARRRISGPARWCWWWSGGGHSPSSWSWPHGRGSVVW